MINPDPKMIAQLNLLSDLIGSHSSSDSSRTGIVKLSLFDEEDEDEHPPIQKRSQVSTTTTQKPSNDDITIDVSKVDFSRC